MKILSKKHTTNVKILSPSHLSERPCFQSRGFQHFSWNKLQTSILYQAPPLIIQLHLLFKFLIKGQVLTAPQLKNNNFTIYTTDFCLFSPFIPQSTLRTESNILTSIRKNRLFLKLPSTEEVPGQVGLSVLLQVASFCLVPGGCRMPGPRWASKVGYFI